jgi:hypothetical protein
MGLGFVNGSFLYFLSDEPKTKIINNKLESIPEGNGQMYKPNGFWR